jgi:hypothetical protein
MYPHPQTRNNCTTGYKLPWIGGQFNYTKEDNLAYPAVGLLFALIIGQYVFRVAIRSLLCSFARIGPTNGKYDFVSNHTKYCTSLAPFEDIMTSRIGNTLITSIHLYENTYLISQAGDVGGYIVSGSTYFYEDPQERSQ